ncbi:MAG TPA: cupin domain-containing protein [Thermoleophilaceae bacterium]|nr:cupin domain-containing protein [Thermoleophilaceae bacterium]
MADYVIRKLEDIPDVLGDYPGEMRMATPEMGNEQVAFTHRRMPPDTGGKGSYGHHHKTQEEIYFVVSGTLTFKLGDDLVEAGPGTIIRIPPHVVRSVHNETGEDAELVMVSVKVDDPRGEVHLTDGFWPG